MNDSSWYNLLIKPSWAPPDWIFGIAWGLLYPIIFVTFGSMIYQAATGKLSWPVATPFILNLIFNALFTPLQFGLRSNTLALLDISLVLITLVWALIVIWPHMKWVSYANIPYLMWGLFATALQITITWLNR